MQTQTEAAALTNREKGEKTSKLRKKIPAGKQRVYDGTMYEAENKKEAAAASEAEKTVTPETEPKAEGKHEEKHESKHEHHHEKAALEAKLEVLKVFNNFLNFVNFDIHKSSLNRL